jgi:hypothetical protein
MLGARIFELCAEVACGPTLSESGLRITSPYVRGSMCSRSHGTCEP